MVYYHGTSHYRHEKIKSVGMLMTTNAERAVYSLDSSTGTIPNFVYLTDSALIALHFGIITWLKECKKYQDETPRIVVYRLVIPNVLEEDPDNKEYDKKLLTELDAKAYICDKDLLLDDCCEGIAYFLFGTPDKAFRCLDDLANGKLNADKIKWKDLKDNREFTDYYSLITDWN